MDQRASNVEDLRNSRPYLIENEQNDNSYLGRSRNLEDMENAIEDMTVKNSHLLENSYMNGASYTRDTQFAKQGENP